MTFAHFKVFSYASSLFVAMTAVYFIRIANSHDAAASAPLNPSYPTTSKHPHTAGMNSAQKNIAIEKNRIALLRIVRFWLAIAAMFGASRVLPHRIGSWASDTIFKIEKAVYYLQIASGYVEPVLPVERDGPCTICDVIHQLKRVKRALIRLKPRADNPIQTHRRSGHPRPGSSLTKSARCKLHVRLCACHNSRAPPSHHQCMLLFKNPHETNRSFSSAVKMPDNFQPFGLVRGDN
jgi:hypothetical protein